MRNTIQLDLAKVIRNRNYNPYWLLAIGLVLMTMSHLNWNIDFIAWICMVPFLLFLRSTTGIKSRLLFFAFLILSWSFIVLKIITFPIPYYLIPLYSIPIAAFHLPGYLIYDSFKSHRYSVLIFPAMMSIMEWIQYTFTPFASWGVAAYTQLDSINISQSLSLFGMAGLSFLIYWSNAALVDALTKNKLSFQNSYFPIICILLASLYGHLRLDLARTQGNNTLKVATVGTDSEIGGLPLPDLESNEEVIIKILDRTENAARAGAKLIVWNEAAFYLLPENEKSWLDSISKVSRRNGIAITASYVVPVSIDPFQFENKFVQFGPDGKILNKYLKHQPVPGEPAIKGYGNIESSQVFGVNIGGAICYDYDFPYLARKNRESGVDILALPSSDWRGIDPIHTKMATFRAIEQGHSIIRSTRFGLSAVINPFGEMVAHMSSFDINDKILISDAPSRRISTLYSFIGDILIYFNIGFLVLILCEHYIAKFKNGIPALIKRTFV